MPSVLLLSETNACCGARVRGVIRSAGMARMRLARTLAVHEGVSARLRARNTRLYVFFLRWLSVCDRKRCARADAPLTAIGSQLPPPRRGRSGL